MDPSDPITNSRTVNPDLGDSTVEFQIRPPIEKRFPKDHVKEILHTILNEELNNKTYEAEEMKKLSVSLATKLKNHIKAIVGSDYKLVILVTLGEQRGAGVRSVARCLWDSATDEVASLSYVNDSLFCVISVFAVYFY